MIVPLETIITAPSRKIADLLVGEQLAHELLKHAAECTEQGNGRFHYKVLVDVPEVKANELLRNK